jgi:aldehyde dehydrogenase (NAD+)
MSVNVVKQSAQSENLSLKPEVDTLLVELGVEPISYTGGTLVAKTPITGETVAHVREVDAAGTISAIEKAHAAFLEWRLVPAPKRGELVRLLGEELRANKRALGRLVSIEAGKIESEGPRRQSAAGGPTIHFPKVGPFGLSASSIDRLFFIC